MRSAVVVAAGSGERFGGDKIFKEFVGLPVLARAAATFFGVADEIVFVVNAEDSQKVKSLPFPKEYETKLKFVSGGVSRAESVKNGLAALDNRSLTVAIHDGARPFTTGELTKKCFVAAEKYGSAIPVTEGTDSVYANGKPMDRSGILLAQTPQVFDTAKIKEAYENFQGKSTDDGGVFFARFGRLNFIEGDRCNKKITFPCDLPDVRTGCGFDLHVLKEGRPMILGGIKIPCDRGPDGHSDADAVLHAVTDALLCAAGERDIGSLFPDDDARFKDIDSRILLKEALRRATEKGFSILFASVTVIAQSPKLAPHIDQMKQSIAQVLSISPLLVNINATTAEKQGTIGEGRAIACDAVVTLIKIN